MRRTTAFTIALLACSGGGGSVGGSSSGGSSSGNPQVTLDTSDLAHDCMSTDDCMAVVAGNVCNVCACQSATIAKKALEEYQRRQRDLRAQCGPQKETPCANDCAEPRFACLSGTCTWGVRPPVDAGTD